MTHANNEINDAVAVIGMAARFPGARDIHEFWENLKAGTDTISVFTDDELIAAGVQPQLLAHPNYVRSKGILRDVEAFDASFFGFNPREAEILDPQHRLFLEESWHALEDAGYDPFQCDRRIGVFAGCGTTTYLFHLYNNPEIMQHTSGMSVLTSNDKDYLTTRISYKLNLRGPSVNVQSACSTSLVAISMAAHSILNYQCDMALAGGVSIRTPQINGFVYQEGGILSPDGHCRTFDVKARGTVFSSGLGVVVLKRLSEALADRDHIYAVIRGAALNNDGVVKIGFTAPSVDGQAEAAAEAIAISGVHPEDISYVEAHGTATQLGDPIEIGGLTKVFRAYTDKKTYCAIGSVKTNIGHTDIAAGAAGLIKTALSLKHKLLPPSLHFTAPNPELHLDETPFYVNTRLTEWQRRNDQPLRAGVSSFGVGGTNAHVVLEEAPERPSPAPSREYQIVALSAKTDSALDVMSANLAALLEREQGLDFADVAYTSKVGRRAFEHRRVAVCRDRTEAIEMLGGEGAGAVSARVLAENVPVIFMFSGQGSQYVNMGKGLYESEAVFRAELDRCCELLRPHLGLDLRTLLYPQDADSAAAAEALRQTRITQPALFAIEYATARLWMSWGVQPEAMIGHSVGEYVAACLSDVFSLEDALALIAQRGKLMQSLPGGAMLAVMLPEARVRALLNDQLSVAAVNSPSVTVISGSFEAVDAFEAQLKAQSIMSSRLQTSHAFHSSMMDPIVDIFAAAVARVQRNAPRIPFVSNVTGSWATAEEVVDPQFWARHLRGTVRFADGLALLLQKEERMFLEVGPGHALQNSLKSTSAEAAARGVYGSIRHPARPEADAQLLTQTLSCLWAHGVAVDWSAYYAGEERHRVPLPGYPFERERYFVEPVQPQATSAASPSDPKTLTRRPDIADWFYVPTWKGTPSADLLIDPAFAGVVAPWLVFCDEIGLGERLAATVRAQGREVICVRVGRQFEQIDTGSFRIDPADKEHYSRLFGELRHAGRNPARILHLWNVTEGAPALGLHTIGEAEDRSFYSLLFLGQMLAEQPIPTKMLVVSNLMQDVAGEGRLAPGKALLIGPCKLISKECLNIECRGVDVDITGTCDITEALVQQLVAESSVSCRDTVVAYRGPQRWVESYEPVRVGEKGPAGTAETVRLKQRGTYLVTGGLGGIGLAVALYLARSVQARLVLVGRSVIPPRAGWEQWLNEHHPADAISAKIRGLMEVERAGGEVLALSADVASMDEMAAVLSQAADCFGHIDGVFHVAGVAGGGLIPLKTRENAARVLAPKVRGTLVLDELLKGREPDFTVLFSSLTSAIGGTGQVDYAAANAFLDAFAGFKHSQGEAVISVDWDMWAEVGMGVGVAERTSGVITRQDTYEKVQHGLLKWLATGADRETYSAALLGAKHWSMGEHWVLGKPTLVGTGYIDMVVSAALRNAQGRAVQLSNVYLLAPMTLGEAERKCLELVVRGSGDVREFSFSSRPDAYGGVALRQEHVTGTVRYVDAGEERVFDLPELTRRCALASYDSRQEAGGAANIVFGPRWANLVEIGAGRGEALASIELPEAFVDDLAEVTLHPAMLDVATSFAKRFTTPGFFLPISYKRLTVRQALPRKIYSYARFAENDGREREIVSFDISLMDETGRELVAIEGYSLKRVPDSFGSAAPTGPEAAHGDLVASANSGRLAAKADEGMLTEEGLELLRRILDRPFGPRIALSRFDYAARLERQLVKSERGIEKVRDNSTRNKARHKRPGIRTPYVAPRNELEQQIAEIWEGVLGIEQLGVEDGFIELGGNSLLAVQVVSRIRETLQVDLPLEELYKKRTISGVAESILVLLADGIDGETMASLLADVEAGQMQSVA